ncbi:MAG: mechanosensitive ion channel protein MscL [Anaerolineae bacterium SM23_84]|nr:MAG: mechanosensitive ion channel protein MscL [Anaerolineae bacterium SM23_84]
MWKDFQKFVVRGNVVDLAVGFIMGAAFSRLVSSLVNDIIMPPVGLLIGRVDFGSLFINLSGENYASLAEAQAAGAATINYGVFLNTVIEFVIVAFALFLLIKQVNRLQRQPEEAQTAPASKVCPYCYTEIPMAATRCPNCTSQLASSE